MKTRIIGVVGLLASILTALAADSGGIGLLLQDRKAFTEPLRIGRVVPGSPAERTGIKPESFLISIGGTNAQSMSLQQAMSMLRGPIGTTVSVEIADAAMSQTNKFSVKRGRMVFSKDKVEIIDE